MRTTPLLLPVLDRRPILASMVLWALFLIPVDSHAQKVIIRGGWLFDSVRDEVVPNRGIIIEGEKFLEIGAHLTDEDLAGARLIDLGEGD